MLKRAPTVYVPVSADDNGMVMPTLFSLVIHGAIIAFILLSHRIPKIEMPEAIETQLVTPEELVQMQDAVRANQKTVGTSDSATSLDSAVSLDSDGSATGARPSTPPEISRSSPADPDASSVTTITRRMTSLFTRSPAPPDSGVQSAAQDRQVDNAIKEIITPPKVASSATNEVAEAIIAERKRHDELLAAFQDDLDKQIDAQMDDIKTQVAQDKKNEDELLEDLKSKQTNPPKLKKPQQVGTKLPPSMAKDDGNTTKSASTNKPTTADLRDGTPISTGTGTGSSTGAAGDKSAPKASLSSVQGALTGHIKPYWHPPVGRVDKRLTAIVQVDANGNVLSVSVDSDDDALDDSLEKAIRDASPLTPVVNTDFRNLKLNFKVTS